MPRTSLYVFVCNLAELNYFFLFAANLFFNLRLIQEVLFYFSSASGVMGRKLLSLILNTMFSLGFSACL